MPTSLQPPTGGLRAVDDRHAKADARPPMLPISDHRGDPGSGASGIGAAFPLSRLAAVVFDMDGVITDTATIHRDAWKQTLDTYLERRARLDDGGAAGSAAGLGRYRPFDEDDYRRYVDGKPREAGIRDFLASRDLWLPDGEPGDAPGFETVSGLGLLKNGAVPAARRQGGRRTGGQHGRVRGPPACHGASRGRHLGERERHARPPGGWRPGAVRREGGWPGRSPSAAARQAGPGHLPRGRPTAGRDPGAGRHRRGCPGRRPGRGPWRVCASSWPSTGPASPGSSGPLGLRSWSTTWPSCSRAPDAVSQADQRPSRSRSSMPRLVHGQ